MPYYIEESLTFNEKFLIFIMAAAKSKRLINIESVPLTPVERIEAINSLYKRGFIDYKESAFGLTFTGTIYNDTGLTYMPQVA